MKQTLYETSSNISPELIFDFTRKTLIVGMGGTGISCARYLTQMNSSFDMADSRNEASLWVNIANEFTQSKMICGDFKYEQFKHYKQIIVSPGISIRSELFLSLQAEGCLLLGDIELFAQVVQQPVIAITGSNGKSTVTTLVEKIALDCGLKAIAGGNLGTPALDLLATQSDLYILELSSFQLETTRSLKTLSATVLNVTDDHMDRYSDLDDYRQVKESIYQYTQHAVVNSVEQITLARVQQHLQQKAQTKLLLFGDESDTQCVMEPDFKLKADNSLWIADQKILNANELKMLKGKYNSLNILAALALLEPLQLDLAQQIKAIKAYPGLPHRCEWVAIVDGVSFYNDSKGTNTGATIAAINAFSEMPHSQLILIVGGIGKDADFTELGKTIEQKIKSTILLGVDASQIKSCALESGASNELFYSVKNMSDAVLMAEQLAQSGDTVLLSPACASFDLYQNYMQRGDDFKENVRQLKQKSNRGVYDAG